MKQANDYCHVVTTVMSSSKASQRTWKRRTHNLGHSGLHCCQLGREALRCFGHCSMDDLQLHTTCILCAAY